MKYLMPLMMVMILIPSVVAQFPLTDFTTLTCSTNQTLRIENIEERCIDGVCKNFTITKEEFCQFGCSEDNVQPQCNPSQFDSTLYFTIPLFLLFLGILIYFARRLM